MSKADLQNAQEEDEIFGPVLLFVREGRKPSKVEWAGLSRKSRVLVQQLKKLSFEEGLLSGHLSRGTHLYVMTT